MDNHSLPASWWTSPKLYELEKRAVFHKAWFYITHSDRIAVGDKMHFNVADVQFYLVKDETGIVSAHKDIVGTGLDNRLVSHTTLQGLVFVNFDSSEEGPLPFDEYYAGIENEMREFDFSQYEFYTSFHLDGKFNWKAIVDAYQECYHCPTAHPELSKAFEMPSYRVTPKTRWCRHYADVAEEKIDTRKNKSNRVSDFDGLWMYTFPMSGVNCYSPAWYSFRMLPQSVDRTILQYDVYKRKDGDQKEIDEFTRFMWQLNQEDFALCEATQENLKTGVYSTGFLHPEKEKGVLYYQNLIKNMVLEHFELEKQSGRIIDPATIGNEPSEVSAAEAAAEMADASLQVNSATSIPIV
ncbi:hypothetical protein TRICI_001172 [Trichomonascus ciferrii]|uniref:Choline monooxygenase, chloroplastic n=1 Tax=Trichomonascus ciferrii TaxID=44093 RepID=A0A642VCR6_9ASCO|nr:hypothetical protein TRICI_001172 [Trichomonascus ciferrii]